MTAGVDTRFLFVAGCPRSGTTALARLLNLHPNIVVGLERYKRLYGREREVNPTLFAKERFFDFRNGETSFAPGIGKGEEARTFYDRARDKFSNALFVGDKYPQFFRFYGGLFNNFADAKVVFIVRDPLYVAQSWQRRADDATDWPEKNDARRSVSYWNDALAYTLAYAQLKENAFIFVDYQQFFAAKERGLNELFSWIGAELSPRIEAEVALDAAHEFQRSEKVLAQEMNLDQDIQKEVNARAERDMYRHVLRTIAAQRSKQAAV